MPVNPNKKKYTCTYTSDFGQTMLVVLSAEHIDQGNFGAVVGGTLAKPGHYKMRVLHGSTADGSRKTSIPVATTATANALLTAGVFTWDGDNFDITGYTGEKFSLGTPTP